MQRLLSPGTICKSEAGSEYTIGDFLGGGSQGEVYSAKLDAGHDVAIKFYIPTQGTDLQKDHIAFLIDAGSPGQDFIWPEELVSTDGSESFGYAMPLKEERFKNFNALMSGDIRVGLMTMLSISYNMACAFHALHIKGLCYADISFGNGLFDPENGDFLAIDNDNITINNADEYYGVLGTPDFMAPEVVRGDEKPSQLTDLHSLAVLIFYLLTISHPLYGKKLLSMHCLDLHARRLLLGENPVFIFDRKDLSNKAVRDQDDPYHEAGSNALFFWPRLPLEIRDILSETFTAGLKDGDHRARTSQWKKALAGARDMLFYCGECGFEHFQETKFPRYCLRCGKLLRQPPRMVFDDGKHPVMLTHDRKIYPHHLDPDRMWDFHAPMGMMEQHFQKKELWGLKNATQHPWRVRFQDGHAHTVAPGKTCPVIPGAKIDFGRKQATIY